MRIEFNKNAEYYNLNIPQISSNENINSFSKIILFNLFFFVISKNFIKMKSDEIENQILKYSIPQTLIFKIPIKYGNSELLLFLFIIFH